MDILIGFLIVVQLIVSVLLILIILVQPSKSGGLGGAAFGGGGMGEQLFGARAGNVLTKGTVLFSILFMVNTMALAFVYSKGGERSAARERQATPEAPAMGGLPDAPQTVDQDAEAPITLPDMDVDAEAPVVEPGTEVDADDVGAEPLTDSEPTESPEVLLDDVDEEAGERLPVE